MSTTSRCSNASGALPPESALRRLPLLVADGETQMALDAALLEGLAEGSSPPTFRLYHWAEPTLSLGYHQRRLAEGWRGLTMVRRPSGGRAVWHAGDLTYALVIPRPPGSVAQVYAQVSQFLVRAFAHLGLPLQFGTAGRGYIHNPSCFGTATGADLLFGGRKLVGSAQLHRGGALLQHGSILLAPDRPALGALFGPETAQAVVGLDEILPDLAIHTLQAALETALGEVFACQIVDGDLNGDERGRVEALRPRMRVEPVPGATPCRETVRRKSSGEAECLEGEGGQR